jgi:Ca-activated chloride channel family protein
MVTASHLRLGPTLLSLLGASLSLAQTPPPVFVANTDLQSIAVRVVDKQGYDVHGLTASDFTILEEGHPQQIAFFGAEDQPFSLTLLLDTSWSMRSSHKLEQARSLLAPLLRGNRPGNEIFFIPFTDRVGPFLTLSPDQPLGPLIPTTRSVQDGTALYDALATSLCNMRAARNVRQAIVVITDGADQHSRLTLDRLILLAQSSKPQIFMIGFFDSSEQELYKKSGKTVSLVNLHEIDNPLKTFERVAKESGAESFFPSSDGDLARVVDHVLGILQAEYTLAYYPKSVHQLRHIQVRTNRHGAAVTTRHTVGSDVSNGEAVHFAEGSCTVSPTEHPYPWEPHVTQGLPHTSIYRDDFSDPQSGWPNRTYWRYASGGYEITVGPPPRNQPSMGPMSAPGRGTIGGPVWGGDPGGAGQFAISTGTLVAYGPRFENFRASISVSGRWTRIVSPEHPNLYTDGGAGMVFRLNAAGCYILLLSGSGKAEHFSFRLVKLPFDQSLNPVGWDRPEKTWYGPETQIIPWTEMFLPRSATTQALDEIERATITVECSADRIAVLVNGHEVARVNDKSFSSGQVGMATFGKGRAVFRDLYVEERP